MAVSRKAVGATGRRRIVPMMGIDFIAGNIEQKTRGTELARYGGRKPNIGGRTRRWSNINFLQVNTGIRNPIAPSAEQMALRTRFRSCRLSALATMESLLVLTQVQNDWKSGTVRQGVDPKEYATLPGWVMAVRMAQDKAGTHITPETDTWEWT